METLQRLWKHKLTLHRLTQSLHPINKGWRNNPRVWYQTQKDIPTVLDPVTQLQVQIVPQYIGVLTGRPSNNICVLDVDNKNNAPYEKVLQWLDVTYNINPETTLTVQTKSNGRHYYLQCDEGKNLKNRVNMSIPILEVGTKSGLDFRGTGGYVVAPPTEKYTFLNDLPPMEPPKSFYSWFMGTDSKTGSQADERDSVHDTMYKLFQGVPAGGRNAALYKYACQEAYYRQQDPMGEVMMLPVLKTVAEYCKPPYTSPEELTELESMVVRAFQFIRDRPASAPEPETPDDAASASWYDMAKYDSTVCMTYSPDELGLTDRILALDPHLLWRKETNQWWVRRRIWEPLERPTDENTLRTLALQIILADKKAGGAQKGIDRLSSIVRTGAKFRAFLETLKSRAALPNSEAQFTAEAARVWLGFSNGAYNLETQEFLPSCPDKIYATTQFNYAFPTTTSDTPVPTPAWDHLIGHMFPEQEQEGMYDYIHNLLAYSLLGTNKQAKFIMFIGCAAAGKSLLMRTLNALFGGNACAFVRTELFTGKQLNDATHGAMLIPAADARIVVAPEIGQGECLQAEVIKQLTGGDKITARYSYARDSYTYIPKFVPIITGNVDPQLLGSSAPAMQRRIIKIDLRHTVTEKTQAQFPTLEQDILLELPHIIKRITQYLTVFLDNNLNIDRVRPESIEDSTTQFFEDADVFKEFFSDELVEDALSRTPVHNANAAFLEYQQQFMPQEYKTGLTINALNKRFRDRRYKKISSNGVYYWRGIRLKNPSESMNGMMLQTSSDPKRQIEVTFGETYHSDVIHDDNNQLFTKAQKARHHARNQNKSNLLRLHKSDST